MPNKANQATGADHAMSELTNRVNRCLEKGDLVGAYPLLSELAALQEDLPHTSVTAGLVALTLKRPDEARGHFERALGFHPEDFDAGYNLFLMHLMSGEYDAARQRLDMLIALHPDEPDLYSDRAVVWMMQNESGRALEDLERALVIDPGSEKVRQFATAYITEKGLSREGERILKLLGTKAANARGVVPPLSAGDTTGQTA